MKKLFTLVAVVGLVFALSAPVMAAGEEGDVPARLKALEEAFQCSWKFYGSARMGSFWEKDDEERTGTTHDDTDLTYGLQGNSRIGAKVKLGDITGGFEYGSTPNLRKLYGSWNFGAGSLLIGQEYTPANIFYSNQVFAGDADLLPYGGIYQGRVPMIQVTVGGLKVAFVDPNSAGGIVGGATDVDSTIPTIEASYTLNAGPAEFILMGGYSTYSEGFLATDVSYDIDSWMVGLAAKAGFGPFTVGGTIYAAQNANEYGLWVEGNADPVYDAVTDSIVDCDTIGFTWSAPSSSTTR